ncbi:MAG TPA: hypothetical protein PLA90_17675 [Candidatus Sumerlaeota bacterium]|nr:hypothetical protein [Candidatus Sumerlaeota bacterium]HPS03373.1 hypothetical protein [Candidatus Sumerlaeota bacterium]
MNGPNRRVEFAKVFFLGFFCAVALIALMGQRLSPASPQRIGQYQMKIDRASNGNTSILVIDTTTGAVKLVPASGIPFEGESAYKGKE